MRMTMTWLRLELPRRWRSLAVLALLVALATATVLTATAGARRGQTAVDRLLAPTLPATVTVLPNQPGFDWARVRALPEVAALSRFPVAFGFAVQGAPVDTNDAQFPVIEAALTRTIERPVVLQGRLANPRRAGEVVVTPRYAATHGKHVGDTLILLLTSPQQADNGYDGSTGLPRGPRVRVRIVGVVRSPWISDGLGGTGAILSTPALFAQHRTDIMGTSGSVYINALVRLAGGSAAIPQFRADLARVTGRNDIDVWDNNAAFADPYRRVTGYESACLLAFAAAALATALFLVGQSIARYVSTTTADLQILQSVGLTRWQGVTAAVAAPFLAAIAGASLGVTGAIVASQWMPIGAAALIEPRPGIDADWLVLAAGWVVAPLLVLAAAAAVAARSLSAGRPAVARRSLAAAAALRGLPVSVVIGTRFALEPGRGRLAVPVRPAIAGAVTGVLGVLAAFTFAAGVSDAATHPVRFGQTWQLDSFVGLNGKDLGPDGPGAGSSGQGGPAARALRAVAADRDVLGVEDARIAGAQSGQASVESYAYTPVAGKAVPVVMVDGRMPSARDEIVLGPVSARALHVHTGSVVHLAGGGAPLSERVTGIGFVPTGPHNDYSAGAWLTPAGYDRLFAGAHYSFKFRVAAVALRPGADAATVAHRLNAVAARAGDPAMTFSAPAPISTVQEIQDLQVLPLALSAFLAVLAVAAIGYALTTAVSRRRHELAVLQALGMTRRQTRLAVSIQATVLALAGLAFGIPLGLALGRVIWRVVAGFTPLAYHSPVAVWALLLIAPAALVIVNILAAWPQRHAARLHIGQVLRTE